MNPAGIAVLALLFIGTSACAQSGDSVSSGISATISTTRGVLEVSRPQPIQDIDPGSALVGRFDCQSDGSILTRLDGYIYGIGAGRLALLRVHPDGTVTDFPWYTVPGFTVLSDPKSIFVGNGHIYVLVDARTSEGERSRASRTSLVLVFNEQAQLDRIITLNQDLNPLVLGVFPSGNIVLVSEDSLNRRMAVNVVDRGGRFVREIQLNENDYVQRASQLPSPPHGSAGYSPWLLVWLSKFFASGDHLLLVPLETSDMPILELDENGIVSSVIPHLPDKMILESYISSDSTSFKVQLGSLLESSYKSPTDPQGKLLSIATSQRHSIIEISRKDGSIIRELELSEPELLPACEVDGVFYLLTTSSQGRLQILTAQAH